MKATYKNKIKLRSSKEIGFIKKKKNKKFKKKWIFKKKKKKKEFSYDVGLLILIKREFYIIFK